MLKNYFKVAWRRIWRNKLHSFINIFGLAVGISSCLVIFLIINFDLSFEKHRPDMDRVYRVWSSFTGSFTATNRGVSSAVPLAIKENLVGYEEFTHFFTFNRSVTIPNTEKKFNSQNNTAFVNPNYFDVVQGEQWLVGSPSQSLSTSNQVVLSRRKAELYFGTKDYSSVIGKDIILSDSLNLTITGIIENPPKNTDFDFEVFISFSTIENSWVKNRIRLNDWKSTNSGSQCLVKLKEGYTQERFEDQLKTLTEIYAEQNPKADWQTHYLLRPSVPSIFSMIRAF